MFEKEEKIDLESLDIQYPIKSVYENLEMEYPGLYINIPIEKDFNRKAVIVLTGLSGSGKDCASFSITIFTRGIPCCNCYLKRKKSR